MTKLVRDDESLAVCIPDHFVAALDLREGDEIVIRVLGEKSFEIARKAAGDPCDDVVLVAPDWIDARTLSK